MCKESPGQTLSLRYHKGEITPGVSSKRRKPAQRAQLSTSSSSRTSAATALCNISKGQEGAGCFISWTDLSCPNKTHDAKHFPPQLLIYTSDISDWSCYYPYTHIISLLCVMWEKLSKTKRNRKTSKANREPCTRWWQRDTLLVFLPSFQEKNTSPAPEPQLGLCRRGRSPLVAAQPHRYSSPLQQ